MNTPENDQNLGKEIPKKMKEVENTEFLKMEKFLKKWALIFQKYMENFLKNSKKIFQVLRKIQVSGLQGYL